MEQRVPKELDGASYLWEPNLRRMCEILGDTLLKACVEYALSKGQSKDPNPLLIQYERTVRLPLQELEPPIGRQRLQDIYNCIRKVYDELEE
jgi:hypothetical protein